jgi:sulfur-oxidizing protein SoxX
MSGAPLSDSTLNYRVLGDTIPEPLGTAPGDAVRGRAVVADRSLGLCLLCHTAPIAEERFQGDIAPALGDVGSRLSVGQLRLRLVNGRRLNSASVMPNYYGDHGQVRVAAPWRGKSLLSAQQIEDVIAYLGTLRAAAH